MTDSSAPPSADLRIISGIMGVKLDADGNPLLAEPSIETAAKWLGETLVRTAEEQKAALHGLGYRFTLSDEQKIVFDEIVGEPAYCRRVRSGELSAGSVRTGFESVPVEFSEFAYQCSPGVRNERDENNVEIKVRWAHGPSGSHDGSDGFTVYSFDKKTGEIAAAQLRRPDEVGLLDRLSRMAGVIYRNNFTLPQLPPAEALEFGPPVPRSIADEFHAAVEGVVGAQLTHDRQQPLRLRESHVEEAKDYLKALVAGMNQAPYFMDGEPITVCDVSFKDTVLWERDSEANREYSAEGILKIGDLEFGMQVSQEATYAAGDNEEPRSVLISLFAPSDEDMENFSADQFREFISSKKQTTAYDWHYVVLEKALSPEDKAGFLKWAAKITGSLIREKLAGMPEITISGTAPPAPA
ncbi:MAG TPA: hypothetical protein VHB73_02745 [Alphaproteobacteria bacterium]|nr:hypothetical protein [Alphaproteobacteria bacterium]